MEDFLTRRTLIERIRDQQDEASWSDFVDAYSRYIYVVIRGMGVAHHDGEDIVQTVLLSAWKGLPTFRYEPDRHRFRSWLCTVTRNAVRNFLKRSNRAPQTELRIDDSRVATSLPEIEKIAEFEWETYIGNLAMAAVRKRFQPNVIAAFELFLKGLAGKDVAERMGIPLNTAHVYKKRVQNALTKEILRLDHELG
jgi:RNA polymerase sigma factor (sigma-70 family)